jgi:hypothetical protein
MSQETFYNDSEEKEPKTEVIYCPENHENPYKWRHACTYCDKIYTQEKIAEHHPKPHPKDISETAGLF